MKKLRKKYGANIRFYHCGEYGELNNRPHYHALLFNFDFEDKIHYKTHNGNKYYISNSLSDLWDHGYSVIGDLTFQSAAYVARYCLKKVTGKDSAQYYETKIERIGPKTGTVYTRTIKRKKEYSTMSRRPGVGHGWYKKFKKDVYPRDYVINDGVKMRPPKYYDRQLQAESDAFIGPPTVFNKTELERIKAARIRSAKKHEKDNTPARLAVRHKVQQAQAKRLKRGMENDK